MCELESITSSTMKMSNETNNVTEISLKFLQVTDPMTWIIIVFGGVAVVTGLLSFVIITKSQELRTKYYILYAAVALDDIVMGAAYIGTSVKRHYKLVWDVSDAQTRWTCCWESMVLYFSQTMGLYLATALAADRLLSVVVPHHYKYMKAVCLSFSLIGGSLAFSLFETIYMMFQGRNLDEIIISCGTGSCWSRFNYVVTLYAHLSMSFLLVIVNLALIILIRFLLEKAKKKKTAGWLEHAKSHLRVDILKTLTIVIVSHVSSHISTRLGLLIIWYVSDQEPELTLTGMVLRNLVVINAASHFFIYYFGSNEFRSNANKFFASMSSSSPQSNQVDVSGLGKPVL